MTPLAPRARVYISRNVIIDLIQCKAILAAPIAAPMQIEAGQRVWSSVFILMASATELELESELQPTKVHGTVARRKSRLSQLGPSSPMHPLGFAQVWKDALPSP